MRLKALLALALAAGPAAARAAQPPASTAAAVGVFDGEALNRARLASPDGKTLNFCSKEVVAAAGLPLGSFAAEPGVSCTLPKGGDPVSDFLNLSAPGEEGGAFARRGVKALLASKAGDPKFRARLRNFYGRVEAFEHTFAPPAPGWAWKPALEAADADPVLAVRLAAYCGRDDADQLALHEPRPKDQARSAFEAAQDRLKMIIGQADGGKTLIDPLARSREALAANDIAAAREILPALREQDFAQTTERLCPPPGSVYYKTDGLGAGRAGPAAPRRAYTGALLACELLEGGASPELAERLPANGAWIDRLLRINGETQAAPAARAFDGGALGDLAPARADAFHLLAAWDPAAPFPGPHVPPKPEDWSPARFEAARAKLDALAQEWRRAVDDYAAGARFGARACAFSPR